MKILGLIVLVFFGTIGFYAVLEATKIILEVTKAIQ